MSECNICCEKYNKKTRTKIKCEFCNFTACKVCHKKYLIESKQTSCMSNECFNNWSLHFLYENFTKNWVNKQYKKIISQKYFDQEMILMPATQHKLTHNNKTLSVKCANINCNGFLSENWNCSICHYDTCQKCHQLKTENHICNKEIVANIELLEKDTKNCPTCYTLIHKINGCDQMWCTQCKTAFSWNTLKIENKVHNPHFYEYLRANNHNIPRDINDVPCNRTLENEVLSKNILKNLNLYNNKDIIPEGLSAVNTICSIPNSNYFICGTFGYIILYELTDNKIKYVSKCNIKKNYWVTHIIHLENNTFAIGTSKNITIISIVNENFDIKQIFNELKTISCLHYIKENEILLSGGRYNIFTSWKKQDNKFVEVQTTEPIFDNILNMQPNIFCITSVPNSNTFFVGGSKLELFNVEKDGSFVKVKDFTTKSIIRCMNFISKTNSIIVGSYDYLIYYKFDNNELKQNKEIHQEYCLSSSVINDCNFLITGGSWFSIKIWKITSNSLIEYKTISNLFPSIYSMIIMNNNLVLGNKNGKIFNINLNLFQQYEKLGNVLNYIQKTSYLNLHEKQQFITNDIVNNENLRIKYLKNKINEETFKNKIFQEYKANNKKNQIMNALNLYILNFTDIVYRYGEIDNFFSKIDNFYNEINNNIDLCNSLFDEISTLYDSKRWIIFYNDISLNILF